MLRVIGLEAILENILALSLPYMDNSELSFLNLKKAYRKYLDHIQPNTPKGENDSVEFLKNILITKKLVSIFEEKSRLDDFDDIFTEEKIFQVEHLDPAEKYFKEIKKIDEELFSIFSLVINIIFSGPSNKAGGGSTSGAIGCIWINPRSNWSKFDFIEFFIHEMTHNLVFIDEYRYHHYTDYSKMLLTENYTVSAILAKRRPLDKVFHSIIVSTEILLTRSAILGHPKTPMLHPSTEIMLEKTLKSINELENSASIFDLLTDRGKELVGLCKKALENIESRESFKSTKADVALL